MKTTQELPSAQYLKECFTYDPENGKVFWKERPLSHFRNKRGLAIFNGSFAGKVAGCESRRKDGHPHGILIRIRCSGDKNRMFMAHRIIYALMGIPIPDGMEVDHKSLDPFDNKWTNLRLATPSQNASNSRARHTKHDLPKGVTLNGNGFAAEVRHLRQRFRLGTFATPEEAHAAYCKKATELHGEFARFS